MGILQGLSVSSLVGIILLVIGGIGLFSHYGSGLFTWIKGKMSTVGLENEDALDFDALARVHRRFKKMDCKEGLDACAVQLQHFWAHKD